MFVSKSLSLENENWWGSPLEDAKCSTLAESSLKIPKKGKWKTTGVSPQHPNQLGGHLPVKGNPMEASELTDFVCYPLTVAAVRTALPQSCRLKSTPTQPNETAICKGAFSGCWGLVIVIHPEAFPGGKHGTVFPDQTWTLPRGSQTHCLVCTNISTSNWTARPGSVILLLYFTNVCVFLPASLGKLPCFMATCHWQGISHEDWNLWLSPKLPALCVSELRDGEARPWKELRL